MKSMTKGQRVRVHPVGEPEKAATATIVLAAENGRSLALSFGEEYVPFITARTGMAIHPEHGKMLLVYREQDNGNWDDLFQGGRFVVSEDLHP